MLSRGALAALAQELEEHGVEEGRLVLVAAVPRVGHNHLLVWRRARGHRRVVVVVVVIADTRTYQDSRRRGECCHALRRHRGWQQRRGARLAATRRACKRRHEPVLGKTSCSQAGKCADTNSTCNVTRRYVPSLVGGAVATHAFKCADIHLHAGSHEHTRMHACAVTCTIQQCDSASIPRPQVPRVPLCRPAYLVRVVEELREDVGLWGHCIDTAVDGQGTHLHGPGT